MVHNKRQHMHIFT